MESALTEYIKNASGNKTAVKDNVVMTPKAAMAKALTNMNWEQFGYDELCDLWGTIGAMKKTKTG